MVRCIAPYLTAFGGTFVPPASRRQKQKMRTGHPRYVTQASRRQKQKMRTGRPRYVTQASRLQKQKMRTGHPRYVTQASRLQKQKMRTRRPRYIQNTNPYVLNLCVCYLIRILELYINHSKQASSSARSTRYGQAGIFVLVMESARASSV